MWKAPDSIGQVELLHTMGDDLMVVNAARVSFNKESKQMTSGDAKLIKYLADHSHVTPFFHPQIQFRIKMPIFVAREWYRHQIGFSRNEVSRRYVSTEPECWLPDVKELREKDSNIKQGSKDASNSFKEDKWEFPHAIHERMKGAIEECIRSYNIILSLDVAPEIARSILPQGMYTEFIETGSLAAYARLYKLRHDPHAQKEIRDYAEAVGQIISQRFPFSWAALTSSDDAA